jgi:hypothetical protein
MKELPNPLIPDKIIEEVILISSKNDVEKMKELIYNKFPLRNFKIFKRFFYKNLKI